MVFLNLFLHLLIIRKCSCFLNIGTVSENLLNSPISSSSCYFVYVDSMEFYTHIIMPPMINDRFIPFFKIVLNCYASCVFLAFSGLNKISGQHKMVTAYKYLFTCFLFLLFFLFSPKKLLKYFLWRRYTADKLHIFSLWNCFISSLFFKSIFTGYEGFPSSSAVKNLPAVQETQETWVWSQGSIPRIGRSPGGGNGNQYSCQENPMDRGAWLTGVHGVAKSQTQLSTHATWTRKILQDMKHRLIIVSFSILKKLFYFPLACIVCKRVLIIISLFVVVFFISV